MTVGDCALVGCHYSPLFMGGPLDKPEAGIAVAGLPDPEHARSRFSKGERPVTGSEQMPVSESHLTFVLEQLSGISGLVTRRMFLPPFAPIPGKPPMMGSYQVPPHVLEDADAMARRAGQSIAIAAGRRGRERRARRATRRPPRPPVRKRT